MRASALTAWILAAAALAFSGTAAKAQDRHQDRQDLRGDYRDVQHDYGQTDRLRSDIARDRYQRDQARRYGDHYTAHRLDRDIDRDKHALKALERDIRHDRHDIHRDQRDLYRDGYYR
jgi:hypothetical protein